MTVNFTRKGNVGGTVNMFYMFANATLQNTATTLHRFYRSPKARAAGATILASGVAFDSLMRLISGEDDDGEKFYDKIPEYEKARAMHFMTPGGDVAFSLPLAYGPWATLFHYGRGISEIADGRDMKKVAWDMMGVTAESMNPLGAAKSMYSMIAPTFLDPAVEIARNRNFADVPIMHDANPFGGNPPPSENYFRGVTEASKAVAREANRVTGGDEVTPGWISVSPELIDYSFGVALGGVGRFLGQSTNVIVKAMDPTSEPIEKREIPFVRRLKVTKGDGTDQRIFYERAEVIEDYATQLRHWEDPDSRNRAKALEIRNSVEGRLIEPLKAARSDLRSISRDRKNLEQRHEAGRISDEAFKQRDDVFQSRVDRAINRFNTRYNKAVPMLPRFSVMPEGMRNAISDWSLGVSTSAPPGAVQGVEQKASLDDFSVDGLIRSSSNGSWTVDQAATSAKESGLPVLSSLLKESSVNSETLKRILDSLGRYPDKEDTKFASESGAFYGQNDESFTQGKSFRSLAENVVSGSPNNLASEDVSFTHAIQELRDAGRDDDADLAQEVYQKANLAVRRNPIAKLGYDPRRVGLVLGRTFNTSAFSPEGAEDGGGHAYANAKESIDGKDDYSTIVHESIHRGIERLWDAGKLPDDVMTKLGIRISPDGDHVGDTETVTRWIMASQMGDPEVGGETGQRQMATARRKFSFGGEFNRSQAALRKLEKIAADYWASEVKPRMGPN